jgi:hypothetical protein
MWISFRAFAREQAFKLTAVSLLANATLLIPLRAPNMIGVIALMVLVGVVLFDWTRLSDISTLKTWEGRTARAMPYLAYLALIVRTMSLYHTTQLFSATLFAAAALFIYYGVPRVKALGSGAADFQAFSALPLAVAWGLVSNSWISSFGVIEEVQIPLFALPYATMLFLMGYQCLGSGINYRKAAILIASASFVANVWTASHWLAALSCLVAGIAITIYGYQNKVKMAAGLGLTCFVFGIAYYFLQAIEVAAHSPWITLGSVGIATIIVSSLVEKNYGILRERFGMFKNEVKSWS